MRICLFAGRTAKEMLRDPLTLLFGLGFPLVLLGLLSAMQQNIPVPLFELESLTPGISVFGLSFLTLFSALLSARDRTTAFMQRLCTTPLTPLEMTLGYALPMLPMGLCQTAICYAAAMALGLQPSTEMLWAILANLPTTALFISLGLLCGAVLTDRQVGGICGALVTNLTAWLSGIWFDTALIGEWFVGLTKLLPFYHAVELGRAVLQGQAGGTHLAVVGGYAVGLAALAVLCRQLRRQ